MFFSHSSSSWHGHCHGVPVTLCQCQCVPTTIKATLRLPSTTASASVESGVAMLALAVCCHWHCQPASGKLPNCALTGRHWQSVAEIMIPATASGTGTNTAPFKFPLPISCCSLSPSTYPPHKPSAFCIAGSAAPTGHLHQQEFQLLSWTP